MSRTTILTIAMAAMFAGGAHGQLSYVSQNRSVIASSVCSGGTQTLTAPDFGPFQATAWVGDSGCWGEASQNSTLLPIGAIATGTTRGYRGSTSIPYPGATSHFSATFDVAATSDFRLVTHWNYSMWSFTGPGVALSSFGTFGDRSDAGKLVPGQYTLQATANLEHMAGWIIPTDFAINLSASCVADVDDGTGTGSPDGGVTTDDLLYYLYIFERGTIAADVDDGSGTGALDGGVTIDDLLYYLVRFEAGC